MEKRLVLSNNGQESASKSRAKGWELTAFPGSTLLENGRVKKQKWVPRKTSLTRNPKAAKKEDTGGFKEAAKKPALRTV